jgi:histidinol-phosphatase (PHP family)
MELACARAREVGLPGVAFTEHVDFTDWAEGDTRTPAQVGSRRRVVPLDIEGYAADIARCRDLFPDLRILSGIEAGEPHLFAASVAAVLAAGDFQRVLGSLHAMEFEGRLEYVNSALFRALDPHELMRQYLQDMVVLVGSSSVFNVLAHCDYPRRYWPADRVGEYREADFEEGYREVFRELASSGRALELNTSSPLASAELIRWWHQEGGDAVSFGSDAHTPFRVGDKFDVAVHVVEAAGFKPGRDQFDFWRR